MSIDSQIRYRAINIRQDRGRMSEADYNWYRYSWTPEKEIKMLSLID